MAFVILGLLLLRPMSYYDLIRAFESGVSLFYSASSGSIKRALDGLLAKGLVDLEPTPGGARGRKVYRVNDAGRVAFRTWMRSEVAEANAETGALSRLFFLGLLEADERPAVLGHIEARVRSDLARLEALAAQVADADVPDELAEVARFQRSTLDYGLASSRFALDWFSGLPGDS